jgi:NAD+ kinase
MTHPSEEQPQWKRIGLVVNRDRVGEPEVASLVARVRSILSERDLDVVLDRVAASCLGAGEGVDLPEMAAAVDLCLVLGGDGTVLATARAIGERAIPILPINLGQLGFLADVPPELAESALQHVLDGDYDIRERSRLRVTLLREDGSDETDLGWVLNDVVIAKSHEVARMIELETRVDGRLVSYYRADGLILSTPTGSTAYNLSAGGPLVDPGVSAVILTPICPHTLSQRPHVLSDERSIEVRLSQGEGVRLTLDGQAGHALEPGHFIRAIRAASPARFVTLSGYDRFETLRTKLGWGAQ